jgi:hypothetical protein
MTDQPVLFSVTLVRASLAHPFDMTGSPLSVWTLGNTHASVGTPHCCADRHMCTAQLAQKRLGLTSDRYLYSQVQLGSLLKDGSLVGCLLS